MRRPFWSCLTASALLVLLGVQVFRAATTSITVDEARVWEDFISPQRPILLNTYDAAYHVLQTWMTYVAVKCFGDSELVMRLPALLACAAYLAFAYRFARRLFGESFTMFAAALFLATNPLVLDHLALARGYGVALALFAWSLDSALQFIESGNRWTLTASGVLSGLAVAANLTFVPVVLGLAAATMIASYQKGHHPDWINDYAGPGAVVAALVLMLPLAHLSVKEHFYFGAPSIHTAIVRTATDMFGHRPWGLRAGYTVAIASGVVTIIGLIARHREPRARFCAMILSTALAVPAALHWTLGSPYPSGRTALALMVTFALTALTCARQLGPRPAALFCATAALFQISVFDPRFVAEWRFTSQTKRFVRMIGARERTGARTFQVSGDWEYAFPANYYRQRFNLKGMRTYERGPAVSGADYYLLFGYGRRQAASSFGARILADDNACGCLLAAR